MSYQGAGILLFAKQDLKFSILLAQRRRSGIWSIPGGGREGSDSDEWSTAHRETTEEFGKVPEPLQATFSLTYPFGILGFHWTTFVVEVTDPPPIETYPNRQVRDFVNEFRDAAWFPIDALPPKIKCLLYSVIWKLRMLAL